MRIEYVINDVLHFLRTDENVDEFSGEHKPKELAKQFKVFGSYLLVNWFDCGHGGEDVRLVLCCIGERRSLGSRLRR